MPRRAIKIRHIPLHCHIHITHEASVACYRISQETQHACACHVVPQDPSLSRSNSEPASNPPGNRFGQPTLRTEEDSESWPVSMAFYESIGCQNNYRSHMMFALVCYMHGTHKKSSRLLLLRLGGQEVLPVGDNNRFLSGGVDSTAPATAEHEGRGSALRYQKTMKQYQFEHHPPVDSGPPYISKATHPFHVAKKLRICPASGGLQQSFGHGACLEALPFKQCMQTVNGRTKHI